MPDDSPNVCPNCGSADVQRFCPICGQQSEAENRAIVAWTKSALEELLNLDGRTGNTLRALFTRPGALTLAWMRGERARYTPPLRLYLVSSLLFFGVLAFLGTGPLPVLEFLFGVDGLQQDEAIHAIAAADPGQWPPDLLRVAAGTFHDFVEDTVTLGLIIIVPAISVILTLLFFRATKWYFVDHLVHAVHVISFALLVCAVSWPLFFLDLPGLGRILGSGIGAVLLLYGGVSFSRVYGLGPLKTAIAYPAMLVLGTATGAAIYTVSGAERRIERPPWRARACSCGRRAMQGTERTSTRPRSSPGVPSSSETPCSSWPRSCTHTRLRLSEGSTSTS